jgi:hypothetical protein
VSYSRIAKVLGISANSVQHICRQAVKPVKRVSPKKLSRILEQEHIDYLTSFQTMKLWAGFTLKYRTVLFHRRFINKTIAVTSLRRLYLKHCIKRKKVRQEKSDEYRTRADYKGKCRAMERAIIKAREERRTIIYLDEICFTKLSLPNREWSKKNSNLTVEQEDVYQGYRAVLVSMTEGRGIENLRISDHAFDGEDFLEYLKSIRRRHGRTPLALLMDNLGIHKCTVVKPYYEKLGISCIWCIPYSPEYNPIESVFSRVKSLFNKKRLNEIVNRRGFNFDRTIEACFGAIRVEHVQACVRKSKKLLAEA